MGMLIHRHFVEEAGKAETKPAPKVEEVKAEAEIPAPKKRGGRKKAAAE